MVHYSLNGVCYVAGSVEKKIEGVTSTYYELRPYYRKSDTIYLPIQNEALMARVRPLISPEEIDRILKNCRKESCSWVDSEPQRRELFKSMLKSGDPKELVLLTRALYNRKQELSRFGKKLRTSDIAFLKDAERLLHEEFAYVLNLSPQEVPAYIDSYLTSP
ncbi:MAG: hypothetical protein J6H18_03795 [Lachnospiraceae bacterium]|nr:hypothetical protein [Lachnospiraceae bacterium]